MKTKQTYFIANWKALLSLRQSFDLAFKLEGMPDSAVPRNVKAALCPSWPALPLVYPVLERFVLGTQDISMYERGAYTGEVPAKMLKETRCRYAIVGHSERRRHLDESDAMVAAKLRQALVAGLAPILCVGETAEQRKVGRTQSVIRRQASYALKGLRPSGRARILIAYEPIWSISPSKRVATPAQAEEAVSALKRHVERILGKARTDRHVALLYGGSVNAGNIASFAAQPSVDGVLVGSASTKVGEVKKMLARLA